jgi:hypothetical protein
VTRTMDDTIITTFEDGSVQALIVKRSWRNRVYYRASFRRVFVKQNGDTGFSYDFDHHHFESLRRVARHAHAWLLEKQAKKELGGR